MKKKLLLHICCAPDEAWVVKNLRSEYVLHCFFSNPNIQPESEYKKRLEDVIHVAQLYDVPISYDSYEPDSWERVIEGIEDSYEGGERCERCFLLRLQSTAYFCKKLNWPCFTTVMSVSPHKNIHKLDAAGELAAKKAGVEYISFNFKKNNGFLNSVKLSEALALYRQDYCGCRLSKEERNMRNARKKNLKERVDLNEGID